MHYSLKMISLKVNVQKTVHIFICCIQYAGQSYKMKIGNKSLENVSKFKYLGTTLRNIICIYEEIFCGRESLLLWFRIFCLPI
jgi:hypothetical protein